MNEMNEMNKADDRAPGAMAPSTPSYDAARAASTKITAVLGFLDWLEDQPDHQLMTRAHDRVFGESTWRPAPVDHRELAYRWLGIDMAAADAQAQALAEHLRARRAAEQSTPAKPDTTV